MRIISPVTAKISEWWHSKPDPNRKPWITRETLYKVAIIGLCFLVIFGICFPVAAAQSTSNCRDGQCSDSSTNGHTNSFLPYAMPLEGRTTVQPLGGPIRTFPKDFARMIHNSYMSNSLGNRYCSIEKGIPKPEVCDRFSKHMEEMAQLQIPQDYERHRYNPEAFREKGMIMDIHDDEGTNIWQITYSANPQKLENQKKVLDYLEKNVLQNPQFFSKTPKEMMQAIKTTHGLLTHKLPDPSGEIRPGQFRNQEIFVMEDMVSDSEQDLVAVVKKNGGSKKDVNHFKNALKKMSREEYFGNALASFTSAERKAFELFAHIPPAPQEIEGQMQEFAEEFQRIGEGIQSGTVDPVSAAAWVHQEIGRIHPVGDGNGRLARAWMNTVLQLGGYEAIVFPDDDRYTAEVRKDQLNPGSFVHFLREIIEWNQNQRSAAT